MLVRLLLTLTLAASFASAQGGRGGGGGGGGEGGMGGGGAAGGMGGGMPRPQRQSKQDLLFEKLKLSKEQKEQAQQIVSATMEKSATVRTQLSNGRQIIAGALIEKRNDEDMKKLFTDYATLSAVMTGFEAEAFSKIYLILKPNQQAKAPQAFELMAGMFAGGGRGVGRGGPGRGQGSGEGQGRGDGGRQ